MKYRVQNFILSEESFLFSVSLTSVKIRGTHSGLSQVSQLIISESKPIPDFNSFPQSPEARLSRHSAGGSDKNIFFSALKLPEIMAAAIILKLNKFETFRILLGADCLIGLSKKGPSKILDHEPHGCSDSAAAEILQGETITS